MSRTLTEEDIRLLEKLAPECTSLTCAKSAAEYRSILAPVANHFAKDADDFASRLQLLTDEELCGAKKTLQAAAMTYVAAMAVALAQLLRLIILFGGRRRRD